MAKRIFSQMLKMRSAHAALFCSIKPTHNSQNEKRKPHEIFRCVLGEKRVIKTMSMDSD